MSDTELSDSELAALVAYEAREEDETCAVIDVFDDMLFGRQFGEADKYLTNLHNATTPGALLAALSLSWHAKAELPSRPAFVERCRAAFVIAYGEARAADLMRHRE